MFIIKAVLGVKITGSGKNYRWFFYDYIDNFGRGVCVQTSILGSSEAPLEAAKFQFLALSIGPVSKRDVMQAGTMPAKAKELACIPCFDI